WHYKNSAIPSPDRNPHARNQHAIGFSPLLYRGDIRQSHSANRRVKRIAGAAATEGKAERGIVDRNQRPQPAGRVLSEQQCLMAVVIGVTKHLSPCRRRTE